MGPAAAPNTGLGHWQVLPEGWAISTRSAHLALVGEVGFITA
jgi:hypothetical protein